MARVSRPDVAETEGESSFLFVGAGDCGVLQPFDAAGVLHHSRDSRDGAAGWRMARARAGSGSEKPRAPSREDFVGRVAGGWHYHRGGWIRSALFLEDTAARYGSHGSVTEKSPGLRAFIRTLSRFDAAGDGSVSIAAGSFFGCVSGRHARELVIAPCGAPGSRERRTGFDDGRGACVRANCVWNFLAAFFVEGFGDGDSDTISAGGSGGSDGAL